MNESTPQTQAASYAVTASEAWDWNESQLAELNRHLDKPWEEVPLYNKCLLFALKESGYPVEFRVGESNWHAYKKNDPFMRYRVTPKTEPLVLPSIDWSAVAERFKWLAQNKDGGLILFGDKPAANGDMWMKTSFPSSCTLNASVFASLKPGKGDWKKLIVQRPEVV